MTPHKMRTYADSRIKLRPARFSDSSFFGDMLRNAEILKTSGVGRPVAQSSFLLWCWLQRKYVSLYCIEDASTRIGLIGLYNLTNASGEITLIIFSSRNRRLGYGTKAFSLFIESLPRYCPGRLVVRVAKDNNAALSFWIKLGFRELNVSDDSIIIMCMDLDQINKGRKNG